mgnify:CR=1 FL=1|tara:strand:- start:400 stop:834 length:435 start_codon:yes stop_codon:yes gene_type:complete
MNTKELLKLHDDTCKACRVIMQKKNSDYTGGKSATDPFANFNASTILDIHPVQGLLLRVIDKIKRIYSFTNDSELSVPNETVEDACDDIVNYAILAKAMLLEERGSTKRLTEEQELQGEKRIDIIGRNGNDGLHYSQIEEENAK